MPLTACAPAIRCASPRGCSAPAQARDTLPDMQIRPSPNRVLGIVKSRSRPPAVDIELHIDLSSKETTSRTALELVHQLQPLLAHTNRTGALFVEVVTVGRVVAETLDKDGEPALNKGDVVAVSSYAGEMIYGDDGQEFVLLSHHDIAGRLTLEDAPVMQ